MKKTILALGLMMTIAVTSAFANEEKISAKVLAAFKSEFSTATDVKWMAAESYYRAAFSYNDQNFFAYYTLDGELTGIARYMSALQLPIKLLTDLKKDYSKYWVSDLFEVDNNKGTHYYLTLEDAETVIKMSSSNGSDWNLDSKKRKI